MIAAPVLALSIAAYMTLPPVNIPLGLRVHLVKASTLASEPSSVEPILIEIKGGNAYALPMIYVNLKKTESDEVASRLRTELSARPQAPVHVEAESGVLWQYVLNVIDTAEKLRADVVLVTVPPKGKVARKSMQ
jgi:biopolymer transport protein ExbD